MKTLTQVKDEVAEEMHNCTFKQAYLLVSVLKYDEMLNEVVKRYATEAIKADRESLIRDGWAHSHAVGLIITKSQIRVREIELP